MSTTTSPSREESSDRPASAAAASLVAISQCSYSVLHSDSRETNFPRIMRLTARRTSTSSKRVNMSSSVTSDSSWPSSDDNDFNDISSSLTESATDDCGSDRGSGAEERGSGPLKKRRKTRKDADFARSSRFSAIISSSSSSSSPHPPPSSSSSSSSPSCAATNANKQISTKQTKKSRQLLKTCRELRSAPYFFYIDRSREVDEDALTPLSPPLCIPNFVVKLHAILLRDDIKNTIAWMPHGRSWKVIDPADFEKRILPQYFMQSNIASFHRQANGWGFRRMLKGPDKGSFYNEYFLRALPHLCKKMKRVGGAKTIEDANSSHEPNLYMISEEHPLPETLSHDDLNYVALKTINECIAEGGPKAKMPFVHDVHETIADNNNLATAAEIKEAYTASSIAASARAFSNIAAANKASSSSSELAMDDDRSETYGTSTDTKPSSSATLAATRDEVNFSSHDSDDAVQPIETLESLAKMILQQNELASRSGQGRVPIENIQGDHTGLQSLGMSELLARIGQGNMNLGGYQPPQGWQQQHQASITIQELLGLIGMTNPIASTTAPHTDWLQNLRFPSISTGQQSQIFALSTLLASNMYDLAGLRSQVEMHQNQPGRVEDCLESILSQQRTGASHGSRELTPQTTLQQNQKDIIECIIKSLLGQQTNLHQNQHFHNELNQLQNQITTQGSIPSAVASLHANQQQDNLQGQNNSSRMLLDRIQSLQQQYRGSSRIPNPSGLSWQSESLVPQSHARNASMNSNAVSDNLRDLIAQAVATGIRIGSGHENGPAPNGYFGQTDSI